MTPVSIHQPGYLPWLGYFDKIARSDVHVIFDDVQYEKNSFNNRNKIRNHKDANWLTVPVLTKGKFGDNLLSGTMIDEKQPWEKKHWRSISASYGKAPFFAEHQAFFEELYSKKWQRLLDLNLEIIRYLLKAFGISTELVLSSELKKEGVKSDLVLSLCQALDAKRYYSGALGQDYLDEAKFQRAGIEVIYQDYEHPTYSQVYSGFISHLAAIDLLFNCGAGSKDYFLQKTNEVSE